ncbi:hypothetical protein A3B26_01630 [Candidatus Giovannonibacteria bacterium RIFCSPLOWO2_01_FULL_48_47]|nr:MAG: hypothetical protein A3D61_02950 [Candidatus Giovannonibacteria bacterium RIFCSPHIGHO2_02_FULL_48_15]OGF88409.1 MAG: hypothetical protein A3B26_01630 [Candidatus Giovannonibacteria bacterium RIFCSPLOWO2_01_FULL_48_47]OGF96274.1 MAG: hypothetical protein A2613_01780 [Candidatus Giovannonibacteria bacterium RIFOXYD1_FULL_48_21]HBT81815.1 hypothetical protein [Candidatus Giovannonibacteria bacterium]
MLQDLPNKKRACLPARQGFGLLEIVLAVSLVAGSLLALVAVFLLAQSTVEFSNQKLQVAFLLEEGLEVLRHLRDSGWNQNIALLSPNTDYYLSFDPALFQWSVVGLAPAPISGLFTRSFRIENVSRDGTANIETIYNPANDDPDTKKITMKVSWNFKGREELLTLEGYLTDLFDN